MIKSLSEQDSREGLKRGVDILADAVKVTLGPKGKNVFIDRTNRSPQVTKDGVTVAKQIYLSDPIENMGAQTLKEAAEKTVKEAGDGTTTATVLAQAIVTAGLKNVAAGANPMDLKRGIDKAVEAVVESLRKQSQIVSNDNEKIRQIATVSANGDAEVGGLIADAMLQVGNDGRIKIEESPTSKTYIKVVQGMQFEGGAISPAFITNQEKLETELANPYILVHDKTISAFEDVAVTLDSAVKAGSGRPILFICADMDGAALTTLVYNRMHNQTPFFAVVAPGRGEHRSNLLQDMAILTGAKYISETVGASLKDVTVEDLGGAEKVVFTKDTTTILGGAGDKMVIKERVTGLKLAASGVEETLEKGLLRERIANLAAGIGVIYVGGGSTVEMKEKKDRVEDAKHATRAAVEEGIVAGGGVAYIRAIESLGDVETLNADEWIGTQIVRKALEAPLRQIIKNTVGESERTSILISLLNRIGIALPKADRIIREIKLGEDDYGYNAHTEQFEYLIDSGVIDPTKVARVALQNAASVASMILTVGCSLTVERVKE